MDNPVPVYIAIKNAPSDVDILAIFQFFETCDGDFESYVLAPPPAGYRQKAGFDYIFWLNETGTAASIAAFLWMAYERYIKPKVKRPEEGAHIHVVLRKPDGSAQEYHVENLHTDKEVFIQDFEAKVTEMQRAPGARNASVQAEAEIKHSGMWIRRK